MRSIILFLLFVLIGCSTPVTQDRISENEYQAKHVLLQFEKLQKVHEAVTIDESLVHTVKEVTLESNISFIIFEKTDESGVLFGGFKINSVYYNIGEVGYGMDLYLIQIESVTLWKSPIYKVKGFCGASCHLSIYVEITNKIPSIILYLTSPTVEADLDHDGHKEIIATYGTAPQTEIYQIDDKEEIYYVSLNKALNANAVLYNEKQNQFEAYYEGGVVKRYRYSNGSLQYIKA